MYGKGYRGVKLNCHFHCRKLIIILCHEHKNHSLLDDFVRPHHPYNKKNKIKTFENLDFQTFRVYVPIQILTLDTFC